MQKFPMTVEGEKALREELEQLKKVDRPKIVQAIAEAREHGVIDVMSIKATGKVIFGVTVDLINCDTEEEITYKIVGEDEAEIKLHKISVTSPIARALIGKEEGEVICVHAPGGDTEYEIAEVKHI